MERSLREAASVFYLHHCTDAVPSTECPHVAELVAAAEGMGGEERHRFAPPPCRVRPVP